MTRGPASPSPPSEPVDTASLGMAGRYHLLHPLARGGMAEVFKAALKGPQGFERSVAVKRILPHLSTDGEFRTMFIDEAKTATVLTHPNIVQVYELGEEKGSLYIVMELVDGCDLKKLMESSGSGGLPVSIAAYIGREVARALDYAHRKNVIHRDVSPHNLLLSREGGVKLADFGIAKASLKASQTSAGMLKGKFAYMSPEQASGLPLDARTDIFSLGIVLFEMLAGQRLFLADTDIDTLKRVQEARVQPISLLRPGVPRKIEEAVLRALKKNPRDRFGTSQELAEEMDLVLVSEGIRSPQDILTGYLRDSFSSPGRGPLSNESTKDIRGKGPKTASTTILAQGVGAGLVLMGIVGAGAWFYYHGDSRAKAADPPGAGVVRTGHPSNAASGLTYTEPEVGIAMSPQTSSLGLSSGTIHHPAGNTAESVPREHSVHKQDRIPTVRKRTPHRPEDVFTVKTGTLDVGSKPWAEVYIDGKKLDRTTPVMGIKLPEGRHRVRVVNPVLGKEKEIEIAVRGGETIPLIVDLQADVPATPSGR